MLGKNWARAFSTLALAAANSSNVTVAACDVAVVQGGLTTCMELAAAKTPFLYFPLRRHFEQNRHVRHRLERYGAGRCMDFDTATPEAIAQTISEEMGRAVDYRQVETDGAARAAAEGR